MPDPATLLAILAPLAKSGVLEALKAVTTATATRSTEALLDWVSTAITKAHPKLPKSTRDKVLALIAEENRLYRKLVAQMKPADRRGILFVGPSGGGKTTLMNAITNRTPRQLLSTVAIDNQFVALAGSFVAIHDSPGQRDLYAETINSCVAKYKPTILGLVVANGYLDSIGTGTELKRPEESAAPNLDEYLDRARKEELEWLRKFTNLVKVPRPKVKYLTFIINKLDIWAGDHDNVISRYNTLFSKELERLAEKIAVPNQSFQVATVAATYDAFKQRVAAHVPFSQEVSKDSIRILKAFLAILLLNGEI